MWIAKNQGVIAIKNEKELNFWVQFLLISWSRKILTKFIKKA